MESKRKLWIIVALACFFVGASFWLLTPSSASRVSAAGATTAVSESGPAKITLHVTGRYEQLLYEDASDLPETVHALSGPARPIALAQADINNDGIPDLLATYVTGSGSELRVRLGLRTGELDLPQAYMLGTANPKVIAFGDFNVDGLPDAIIADPDAGTVSMLAGAGNGTFAAAQMLPLSGKFTAMAVGDINRDGLDDLVVVDGSTNSLRLILGQGDLSKAEAKVIAPVGIGRIADVKLAYFNDDFYLDLAIAGDSGVSVLYGDGKGNFGRERRLQYSGSVNGMVVTDLNGDQRPDIAVSGSNGVTIWNDRMEKGFSKPKQFFAGAGVRGLVAGSFNGDGFTDLAVINEGASQVSVLLNNNGHGFSEPLAMDVDRDPVALASGNFRLNGIDGIAIGKADGGIVLAIRPYAVTLQVSTLIDEDNCPNGAGNCTSAQYLALKTTLVPAGGGSGLSFREALNALNNDALLNPPKINQGIGFAGLTNTGAVAPELNDAPLTPVGVVNGVVQDEWLITFTLGPLPPILAQGTTIDGTAVKAPGTTLARGGPNNTLGPKVTISATGASGLNITSSASGSMIKGIGIINAPGNAIIVAGNNSQILQNNIGFDGDTTTAGSGNGTGNTGVGVQLNGVVNCTVSNNFIGLNTNGVELNGPPPSTFALQNNVVDSNKIGLDRLNLAATNTLSGVVVQEIATGNTISNNNVSSNTNYGITVRETTQPGIPSNNIIKGNKVGTDFTGQMPRPNGIDGISVGLDDTGAAAAGNPKFTTITQNLVSGNTRFGISLSSNDVQAQFNVVSINKIGVNSTGSVQLPNGALGGAGGGILITGSANGNLIGGTSTASANQISGNNGVAGIELGGAVLGATGFPDPDNNVIANNSIGPNNLGTAAPFDPNNAAPLGLRSNKGGGILVDGNAFSNVIATNVIAFNNGTVNSGGISHTAVGQTVPGSTFNTFTANNIFLNPPDTAPTIAQINDVSGQEGMTNAEVPLTIPPQPITSLIKIDSAITFTGTGRTTVKGTVDFANNLVTANINSSIIELFVSKRGSETMQVLSEGQLFLNALVSFQPDSQNNNVLDWSADLTIPAGFIPPQSPTVFLTATVTSGTTGGGNFAGSTSPFSIGKVPQFVSTTGQCSFTVTPSPISFSNAPVGQATAQTITIANTGNQPLTITSLSITPSGSPFTVSGITLPVTLNPGGSTTFTLSFTPTGSASVTATLNIGNSCTGTSTVSVSGNGCQPTISATPNPVDFGTVQVGSTKTMDVTVSNSGCQGATLTFTAALSSTSSTSFSISKVVGNVITLAFTPGAPGAVTGTLVITGNASNSPLNVPITGNGSQPQAPLLQVIPANVIFGDVPVGTTATQAITIRNVGNATLNVSTPVVQSGANLGFSVSTPPSLSLGPGQSTQFQVSFKPVQPGAANGTVLVSSNGGNQTIVLAGNGVAAKISLSATLLDFGSVTVNQTATRTLSISNTGTGPLNITSFSITGGSANGFSLPNAAPFTVQPSGTPGVITVNFTPSTAGPKSDTLVISSNDPTNPTVSVSLTGSGSDNIPPTVSVQTPSAGQGVAAGQLFTITFTANDNIGVTTFDIRLSTNGGGSFDTTLASGVSARSGQNSFTATAPSGIETSSAVVQVQVRDAAGNVGTGLSSLFSIGAPPNLFNPVIVFGKFKTVAAGSNIQSGAVLVVGSDAFPLTLNASGTKFIVRRSAVSSNGRKLIDLAPPGATVTVTVRNPNGISSTPATITAQ